MRILFIAFGGAIGAVMRYIVTGVVYRFSSPVFPWGTLFVNSMGCFLIGLLSGVFERKIISTNMKDFLLIGTIGAFTTFSTYAFETINLLKENELKLACMNIVLNNLVGILFVIAGFQAAKFMYTVLN